MPSSSNTNKANDIGTSSFGPIEIGEVLRLGFIVFLIIQSSTLFKNDILPTPFHV